MDAELMGNDVMNPIDYLALRQTLDKEVRKIARDIFVEGKLKKELSRGNEVASAIVQSPVYFMMGGSKYYEKGIALEKTSNFSPKRLKDIKDMHESLVEIKNDLNINVKKTKDVFNEILTECIGK